MPDDQNIPSSTDTNVPTGEPQKEVTALPVIANPPRVLPKEEKPSLPPIKHPPFLWEKTQNLLKEIETKTGAKTLVYYLHPSASIANDDPDYFFSHIREMKPESSLNLILISNGGSGMAAWRIANVLRNFCKDLRVIVPGRCASAATLLALSADKILFGPAGYLTAIDSALSHPLNPRPFEKAQATEVSVDQINRIVNFISEDLKTHPSTKCLSEILFEKIHPVVLGELQRSSSLSKLIALSMMGLRNNQATTEEQEKIVYTLNDTYPAHGYPIVLKEAQKIGLPVEPVSTELNPSLWELLKLYSLISKKTVTNLTSSYYHLEHLTVAIESVGKRTFFALSFDKRLMPPPVGWLTENDRSCWLSATPNPESPEKPKIGEIEL